MSKLKWGKPQKMVEIIFYIAAAISIINLIIFSVSPENYTLAEKLMINTRADIAFYAVCIYSLLKSKIDII